MNLLLDGPPEFILLAIMLALMAYLRTIMIVVLESLRDKKIIPAKKKKKQLQLKRLSKGMISAAVLAGVTLFRICLHAIMFFLNLKWKPLECTLSWGIFPVLVDSIILFGLFGLYFYLLFLHFKYDVHFSRGIKEPAEDEETEP